MRIFNSLDEVNNIEETVLALGNFDGIHKGHQEIIRRTVENGKISGYKSAIFTFANHPRNLFDKLSVKNILPSDEKINILRELGVDYMFNIPFDDIIKETSPIDFIDKILVETLRMKEGYCGFNYRFGEKASGTPEVLIKRGIEKGFGLHLLEPYLIDGVLVSSSLIRQLIEEGNMIDCAKYLGRNYYVEGEVVVGNRLGKSIGFPTSNLVIDESMVTPPNGVYVTKCIYNGTTYDSVTNVGHKPTIGAYEKNIETHIFEFNKELYGKRIKVEFIKKTRSEVKFDSIETLSEQITKDCLEAKVYHRSHKG